MRSLFIVLVVAAAAALAACSTPQSGTTTVCAAGETPASCIQRVTASVCSFQPTIQTIETILATLVAPGSEPAVAMINQVAAGICAAVAAVPPAGTVSAVTSTPTYNGVVLHGMFADGRTL